MEAAGLASSILTFIDISFKIVKGAHELYKSASDSTSENNHIAIVVLDLEKAAGNLSIAQSGGHDPGLQSLLIQCRSLSRDLLELLDKLRVRDKTLFKSFAAAFANARKQKDIVSIEHRLDQYRQQILFRLSLLFCQSQAPIRAQLDEIRKESDRLENKHAAELEKTHAKLQEIIDTLRRQETGATPDATLGPKKHLDQIPNVVHSREASWETRRHDTIVEDEANRLSPQGLGTSGGLADLANLLGELKPLFNAIRNENDVLDSLRFDDMFRREDTVRDASSETFAWMIQTPHPSNAASIQSDSSSDGGLRDPGVASNDADSGSEGSYSSVQSDIKASNADHFTRTEHERKLDEENRRRRVTSVNFLSFLNAVGGGSFFVTGKAGSGKSTLMKFLANHQQVFNGLTNWAGGRKLIRVNMFFWNSGTPLQKSLEGFYRTILFHTLRQSPELIEAVFPPIRNTASNDTKDNRPSNLVQAFDRLVRVGAFSTHAFCFFIDGLDEYEGDTLDQKDLAIKLFSWSRAENVKIVSSGRPYTAFLDVFRSEAFFVKLDHLTRGDILNFAIFQFEDKLRNASFDGVRSACINHAEAIADKAEGVFLWASLVVRSLLNAALDYEDEAHLVQLLDECPTDLNSLFRKMLSSIHDSESLRIRSNFIFDLVVRWWAEIDGLNAIAVTWLPEFNWFQTASDFPFNAPKIPYDEDEIKRRVSLAHKQLHLLTRGLLEVDSSRHGSHTSFFEFRVGFFHRSVRDFLNTEWLPRLSHRPLKSIQFQAEVFCRLKCAEVKFALETDLQALDAAYDTINKIPLKSIEDIEKSGCGQAAGSKTLLPVPEISSGALIPIWTASTKIQKTRLLDSMQMDNLVIPVRLSFLHMATAYNEENYVRWRLDSSIPDSVSAVDAPDTSILLSAYVSGNPALVRWLHKKGLRPGDFIMCASTLDSQTRHRISVWEAYLLRLAARIAEPQFISVHLTGAKLELGKPCEILELALQAGADSSLRVIVDLVTEESRGNFRFKDSEIISSHCVALSQLVAIEKPKNEAALLKLLAEKRSSRFFKSKSLAKFTRTSIPSTNKTSLNIGPFPPIETKELARSLWIATGIVSSNGDRAVRDFIIRDF